MAHVTAPQTQQQMQARGGLSDITNLAEHVCQNVKGKLSTGQRLPPSDVLQCETTAHAKQQPPAPGMGSGGLPARLVAPALPQAWLPLEVMSPMLAVIGSPEQHRRNPQECEEYEAEILAALFTEETLSMPHPDYMASQVHINGRMRALVIDWLVKVHMKYKLRRETLPLAVNLIDRYLAVQTVPRNRLQLVGAVCMFVAAKVEEITPPQVAHFVHISNNNFTEEDVLNVESTILSSLGFSIAVPTQAHFLDPLLKANQCDVEEYTALVDYLLELALIDVRMIRHEPSKVVSAALLLSNEIMGRPVWPEKMVQISRHSYTALRGCAAELLALLRAAPSGMLQAVREKYLLQQHSSIARLPEVLAA